MQMADSAANKDLFIFIRGPHENDKECGTNRCPLRECSLIEIDGVSRIFLIKRLIVDAFFRLAQQHRSRTQGETNRVRQAMWK